MKQDIRNLFNKEDELTIKKLPSNHRDEFQKKLKLVKPQKQSFLILKMAASLLILLGIGYGIYQLQPKNYSDEHTISQLANIEKQYLNHIQSEWESFLAVTNDSTLVKRYEKKLDELETDYKMLSNQLKSNPQNIFIIEDLISNLQNRLQLLQDIQNHIQILNKNRANNENTL